MVKKKKIKRVLFRIEIDVPEGAGTDDLREIESAFEILAGDKQFELFRGDVPDLAGINTDFLEILK